MHCVSSRSKYLPIHFATDTEYPQGLKHYVKSLLNAITCLMSRKPSLVIVIFLVSFKISSQKQANIVVKL